MRWHRSCLGPRHGGIQFIHAQSKPPRKGGAQSHGVTDRGADPSIHAGRAAMDPKRAMATLSIRVGPSRRGSSMRDISPTTGHSASPINRIPLWVLIAAFLAGLALLHGIGPATAQAQTAADSTVLLNWTAPGDDGTIGRATTYDIRYRTAAIS